MRSVLYCPGDKEKVLRKSLEIPIDAAIYDLEDAVSPQNKILARKAVGEFLQDYRGKPRPIVRVNCPISSIWGREDLAHISSLPHVDAIVLPKVEDIRTVDFAIDLISHYSPNSKIPIWAMIETPKGVLNALSIAQHLRVECLVFGSNDLSHELRAKQTPGREPLLYSMSQCILAARASRKYILDGVHINLQDFDGLNMACVQGRELGFDGKTLVHPNQVDAANAAYSPTAEDIRVAKVMVTAWEEAKKEGKGVVSVEGRLVEALHVEDARLILAHIDN